MNSEGADKVWGEEKNKAIGGMPLKCGGGHGKGQILGVPLQDVAAATSEIVGASPPIQEVFRAIGRLAHSSVTVLITSESGTGNVIRIHLPALRERRQDIPLLFEHFLKKTSAELGVEPRTIHPQLMEYLCRLHWPGNVRQLENLCRWLTLMAVGQVVHMQDLPLELQQPIPLMPAAPTDWIGLFRQWTVARLRQGESDIAKEALEEAESTLIEAALQFTNGHRQQAAKLLGYGRNTLSRKMKELNLES